MKITKFLFLCLAVILLSSPWISIYSEWNFDTLLVDISENKPYLESVILMTEPSSGGYQVKIVVTTQTNYGVEDEEQYFIITDDNINIFK